MTVTTTIFRGMTEGLDILRQTRAKGLIDYTGPLVDLLERQYIHSQVAEWATQKPKELKLRLKGIS